MAVHIESFDHGDFSRGTVSHNVFHFEIQSQEFYSLSTGWYTLDHDPPTFAVCGITGPGIPVWLEDGNPGG